MEFPAAIEAYEKAYWIAIRMGVPHRTMLLFNALQYVRDNSGWPSNYMEEQYKFGYALAERLGGTPELRVIAILTWALPYVNSDNGPKAEKLYREALAELGKGANVDGGRAARVYMNLGLSLILQAKFEEGIQFNQIAYERLTQIYGEAHPDLIFPLNNIGWALQALGRPAEALSYHEQGKKIIEDLSGPQSKRAGPAYHYRAMALAGLRRYEEARVAYSDLAVLYRKTYGSRHFRTAIVLMEAARTALRSGRLTQAVALVDEAKIATPDLAEETFKGHVHAAKTEIHAQVAIERGDVDGAEKKILRASGILPGQDGSKEPPYPEVSRIWALLYVCRGDLAQAIAAVEPWSTEHRKGRLNLRERPVRWTLVELLTRDGQFERARHELATMGEDREELKESADALRPLGAAEAEWISLGIDVAEGIDADPNLHDTWCASAKFRLGRAAEILNRANHAAHRWLPLQLERASVAIRCSDFELASMLLQGAQKKHLEFGPEYTAQRTRLVALREELQSARAKNESMYDGFLFHIARQEVSKMTEYRAGCIELKPTMPEWRNR